MDIPENDRRFLERRRKLATTWNATGMMVLVGMGVVLTVFFIQAPSLVNPYHVVARLQAGELEPRYLELMAVMLPVAVLLCFFVMAAGVLLSFAVFANERRYIAILTGLLAADRPEADTMPPAFNAGPDKPDAH
ncbi:MAG: hypothetical protein IT365_27035 [Candidatus Hydrogenedentes bacterium]|nr:hypothetical protein [Candidatus Hydrogenedentota bacterium]